MRKFNGINRVVPRLPRLAILAAGGSLLASASALAAGAAGLNVQGKVVGWEKLAPHAYAEAAADPHRYRLREASASMKPDERRPSANVSRDICVAAFSAAAPAHEPLFIKVTGGRVTPSTIVVAPGSRISFENVDPFPHALYEVGDDKWVANPMGPGSSRDWTAAAPGVHQIRDQLFPSVTTYIVVDTGAVEFVLPDHEGGFSMAVPPGDYTFKTFFEGKQVGKDAEMVHLRDRGFQMKDPLNLVGDGK
jgi:plastocyanin